MGGLVDKDRTSGVLERGVALFDSTWTPVYRKVFPLPFGIQDSLEILPGTLIIDELALNVAPGNYYLGLQVNDRERGTQGADNTSGGRRAADPRAVPAFGRHLTAENQQAILEAKSVLIDQALHRG